MSLINMVEVVAGLGSDAGTASATVDRSSPSNNGSQQWCWCFVGAWGAAERRISRRWSHVASLVRHSSSFAVMLIHTFALCRCRGNEVVPEGRGHCLGIPGQGYGNNDG